MLSIGITFFRDDQKFAEMLLNTVRNMYESGGPPVYRNWTWRDSWNNRDMQNAFHARLGRRFRIVFEFASCAERFAGEEIALGSGTSCVNSQCNFLL